jgi:hypothetical protein
MLFSTEETMPAPTIEAEEAFRRAQLILRQGEPNVARALFELTEGLIKLSQGVRATYALVDQRTPKTEKISKNQYGGFSGLSSRF